MAMEMRGSLNVSGYQTKPTQPRFYGTCLIDGVEYKIKGWEKNGPRGPWISLLFENPNIEVVQFENSTPAIFSTNNLLDDDDDIPF